jgi:hypothetical protein
MPPFTLTSLRQQLFKVVDQIIATGVPVEIKRKEHILKIILEQKKNKLDNLKPHHAITGDPEALVEQKVSEWSTKNAK